MGVLTAVLLLGDRSPYGLSVARALLTTDLRLRRVVVPSESGWARVTARVGARSTKASLVSRVRGAISRSGGIDVPPSIADLGEPISPLDLNPGVTVEDLELACASSGIPWQRVDDAGASRFTPHLEGPRPDLILSAAFPFILGRSLLSAPSLGAVNFHPSLLPRCRGCHPIYWTLASGETQGGVTAHFMTEEIDAGEIIAQIPLPLSEQDVYGTLYRRAMESSEALVRLLMEFFASGRRSGASQDPARATYFHEDTEGDHRIRWAGMSPGEVVARIRAGEAFTTGRGERIGLLRGSAPHASMRERRLSKPGRVVAVNEDTLIVAAAGGAVAIHAVAWRDRRYRAGDLARALGLGRGAVLD